MNKFPPETLALIVGVIEFIIMMIPIFTLVWKASELSSRVKVLEKNDAKQDAKIQDIDNSTEASLATIMSSLGDIKVSIARLDERIATKEKTA